MGSSDHNPLKVFSGTSSSSSTSSSRQADVAIHVMLKGFSLLSKTYAPSTWPRPIFSSLCKAATSQKLLFLVYVGSSNELLQDRYDVVLHMTEHGLDCIDNFEVIFQDSPTRREFSRYASEHWILVSDGHSTDMQLHNKWLQFVQAQSSVLDSNPSIFALNLNKENEDFDVHNAAANRRDALVVGSVDDRSLFRQSVDLRALMLKAERWLEFNTWLETRMLCSCQLGSAGGSLSSSSSSNNNNKNNNNSKNNSSIFDAVCVFKYLKESGSFIAYPQLPLAFEPIAAKPSNSTASDGGDAEESQSHAADGEEDFTIKTIAIGKGAVVTAQRVDMTMFRQCTIMLTVYDRHATLWPRLVHLHKLMCAKRIVVIWNAVTVPLPNNIEEWQRNLSVPLHIELQERNSMNNRFKPLAVIDTDCIVNMDDDWDMPHDIVMFATRLWHSSFQNNVVGVWKLARLHGVATNSIGQGDHREYLYLTNRTMPQSIVLPTGMVYHRKYLDLYTNELPAAARKLVDDMVNCDDILFNFLLANATGEPPVFVDTRGYDIHVLKSLGKEAGLWKRQKHFEDRHKCLNLFTRMFGDNNMPLRYTRTAFKINLDPAIAPPKHTDLIDAGDLTCMPCDSNSDCVTCSKSS